VVNNELAFIDMFHTFCKNSDPVSARGLAQKHADRWLVQNPPIGYPSQTELDVIYALPFQRSQHPYYESQGSVKALETIRFSINTHHGCYGECNFCSIAVHEGRTVRWRSMASIITEATLITQLPDFKGYILDVGGPTANMYGFECPLKLAKGACQDKRCIYPIVCNGLKPDHHQQTELLKRLRKLPGVKKVFVGSGLRFDLIAKDADNGDAYMQELVTHHVSGQLKVAPEHSQPQVLEYMGKPDVEGLLEFKREFDCISRKAGKKQYLTYYFIAAHPGCTDRDMRALKQFVSNELHLSPEQVQLFIPLPSTYSALMYATGLDPFTLQPVFTEKDPVRREQQKRLVVRKPSRK
jgi:uncharacterized radical SAM protein YgiQ